MSENRKGPGRPKDDRIKRNREGQAARRAQIATTKQAAGNFAGAEVQGYVRMMTNKQRNEWARRGYPTKLASLKSFAGVE